MYTNFQLTSHFHFLHDPFEIGIFEALLVMHLLKASAVSLFCRRKLKINHEKENKRLFLDYFGEELSKRDQPSPLRTSVGFGEKNRGESRVQKSKDMEKKLTEEQIMFLRRKQVEPIIPMISLEFRNR